MASDEVSAEDREMPSLSFAKRLDEAVMPRCCVFCGTRSRADEGHVCAGCNSDLEYRADVVETMDLMESVVAPLRYAFPVDAAVKALKFKRKLFYIPAFGELLCAAFGNLPNDADALLPVPLHWRRHVLRGFNQAEELCVPLRRKTGLPVLHVIKRRRATPSQSGLHAPERRRNLRSAFRMVQRTDARHVVIVDDVITTGETIRVLARVLLEGGVDKVSAIAVARAEKNP